MTQSVTLLITSGDGPIECRQAVTKIVRRLTEEAGALAIDLDATDCASPKLPRSVIVRLHGEAARTLAAKWLGTIKWICKSTARPGHKRQNWFVGVFEMRSDDFSKTEELGDIRVETFRAGGPGGQHQNTTDSAIRVTCVQTGLAAIARDSRSQHRNKAVAIERLKALKAAQRKLQQADYRQKSNQLHHQLERGNPVRCFKGEAFKEVKM